jgi:hypothetical protein
MAITQNIRTGNGSTVLFNFTFEYLETTDVYVEVNGVLTTAYTFANATTIQFNTAPANGAKIRIYRKTDTENPKATFFSGSAIRAQDLNNNATQSLYSVQEWQDQTVPKYNAVMPDDLDLGAYQIKNLGEPTLAQDAATKNYVDTTTVASAGDTMTGQLNMGSNKVVNLAEPTSSHDAATKNYVDTTTVASAGDNMTGNLAMGTNKVTGLGEPTASQDAATKNYVDTTTWNVTSETIDSTETWVSNDSVIATTGATTNETDGRYDTLVQTSTPAGSGWRTGKTWLQNDVNKTLSVWNGSTWLGVASGGTFTTQPTTIYVDSINGDDAADGRRIINPKKTIKAAVIAANAGDIIKVAPGVYQEALPIDITVANLSIVGEAQRSCFVHPTPATETQIMFRCNSGTYIDGFTFAGLKASGARGTNAIDNDATYGLPANQGWVAGFYPGAIIRKSPYINNATNFADSGIDNSNFNPNSTSNFSSNGGDLTSAPTGGGIIVDGSLPDVTSPLRSFVVNEFTQVCLDGPGLLVCNNGYAQAVSFFGLFCHYHVKALSGGQINMEVGTTDFGRYGLIADGKSTTPIFTATANGAALINATTFAINAPTTGSGWFGDVNRPAINMLAQVTVSGTTYTYPILSSSANGSGWNVTVSRPNPSNRAENLGLSIGHASGATWSFFLRSMVSTASHTMEYAGSGCNYNALPENGGVPVEANESISRNNGRVWLTSTDQSGKFKVGDTFVVDQQTGFVNVDPSSYGVNIVSDLTPELGGDLDTLTRRIYSSINPDITFGNPIKETVASVVYPVASQVDVGTDPNQIPLNQYLGTMAFQDSAGVAMGAASVDLGSAAAPSISFTGDPNTGIYSPGADQFAISTGGTGRVFVDASGRTGFGVSTPGYRCDIQDALNIRIDGSNFANLYFNGTGTRIRYNDASGNLSFFTNSTERAYVGYGGGFYVTSGGLNIAAGIKFPATQVASTDPNTLDDYEEGTFTLTVTANSVAGGTNPRTYANQKYVKIGQTVWFTVEFDTGGWTTATNPITFTGLPFTAAENAAASVGYISSYSFTDPLPLTSYVNGTSIQVRRTQASSFGSASFLTDDNGFGLLISGVYRTA